MYVIRGSVRQDQGVRGFHYSIRLEQSLAALFQLYEELGGPSPHAESVLDERIERCAADAHAPRAMIQSRLHALRRAKDLHRFVLAEGHLAPLKLRLMEHVLFHRSPESRWAAIRELLLEQIDLVCETPVAGLPGNGERYKLALSSRDSQLGRLLVATGLFNFDLCEEEPPANLAIRFRPGRFPEHRWEARGGAAGDGSDWLAAGWEPDHPLCRWAYLAADLAHALFRGFRSALPGLFSPGAQEVSSESDSRERLYCRAAGRFDGAESARQLELLPTTPESVLLELQRTVHRRHGADGLALFAATMALLDESRPGRPFALSLAEVAERALGPARPGRTARSRLAKAQAVIDRMTEVECMRATEEDGRTNLRSGQLLIVIARREARSGEAIAGHPDASPSQGEDPCLEVIPDPLFYRPGGGTRGEAYRDLPEPVLRAPPRRHPYSLSLFVWLRRSWNEAGEDAIQLSARRIFHESGLWVSASSPYRAVEQLKRELAHLKECGLLGGWRMVLAGRRDPLEDEYRLEAPGPAAAARRRPWNEVRSEARGS